MPIIECGFMPPDLLTSSIVDQRRIKVESSQFDPSGNRSRVTTTQESLVAQRTDFINVQFQYNVAVNLDSSDIVGVATGLGSVSHANSMAAVSSGNGAGSYTLSSRDSIRYFTGHEFAGEMTAFVDVAGSNGYSAEWGIGDSQDAIGFAYRDGVFGCLMRRNGVDTFIPRDQMSHGLPDDIDPQYLNLWTFRGGWYGILPLQWGVYAGKDRGYITCHIEDLSNRQKTPHLSNATLPMYIKAARTSGTGNVVVRSASWRGGICGPLPARSKADRSFNIKLPNRAISGSASTVLTPLITLRNNATFQGKINHVRVRYGTLTINCSSATKDVVIDVFKGGTLTGGTFVPKNTQTSVVDYNITATAYTPPADSIGGLVMSGGQFARINLLDGDVTLPVYPGESITLTAQSDNNAVLGIFFRWLEEF